MSESRQDLCYLTIREASRLIERRELSPVELTRAFLRRIEAVDGQLKSYVALMPDSALAEARIAEAEILRGEYRGPLHGIPVAHKGQYDIKGVPTTARPNSLNHQVPSEDATAVRRLREAGSVLLGTLALQAWPVLAVGRHQASPRDQTRNPWNLDYSPGGSSSGSGAAVAAGLCMGSLGEDTAGSIRRPAAMCGVVGLKPTYGRVSRYGLAPLSWSLDHCGPMTWTVEDTALMLQAIAGYDPKDLTSSRAPVPDYSAALREDVKGLAIGVPQHYIQDREAEVDQETLAALDKALVDLEMLGAHVEEVRIPSLEYAAVATNVIWCSECFTSRKKDLQSRPEIFGDSVRDLLYVGSLFTGDDYVQAQRARSRIKREFAQTLRTVDVLALPNIPKSALTLKELDPTSSILSTLTNRINFRGPFNLTGMPAISVPCGFSERGLPIGLQIVGKPFDEPTVLRVAYTYQQHAKWYERRPPI